jgi:glycosyltransferase involved in cell wall biosynthesis
MKILNVSSTIDPVTGGGEAERSFQMSKFLIQSGADCRVLTIDTGLSAERKNFIGEGRVTALPCILRRFYIPKFSFKVINEIVADVDIVHLMGHWTLLNAIVYLAIRKQAKPYVVCPAGALPIFGRSSLFKKIYNILIGHKIIKNASICIAVTPNETESFISYGANLNNIYVIPNGVSEANFLAEDNKAFRKKFGLGVRPFILFVGRLNFIKGPDLLLKAFCEIKNKYPEIDLIFAGPDSGMLSELKSIVKDESVEDRVYFLGYLGGVDKSYAYHAAEFLTIPSRHEAMSIVVLEAGASATPVLMTNQCGFNQVADKGCGWVVPATIEGLRNGLIEILSSPDQIEVAAVNIKEYVMENYSWEIIIQKYWKLYSALLTK